MGSSSPALFTRHTRSVPVGLLYAVTEIVAVFVAVRPRLSVALTVIVQVPLFTKLLSKKVSPEELRNFFADYYKDEKFIKVLPFGADVEAGGALFSDACAGWDGMEIIVSGNEDRIVVATRFDNLGKGASGAAIQCMNIVLGCDEAKGLNL